MLFSVALIDKAKEAKEKDKQAAYTATIGKMYGGAEFFHTADQKLYASFLVKRFDTEGEQVALVADPATRNGHVQGQGAVRLSNRSRRHSADEAARGLYLQLCDEKWGLASQSTDEKIPIRSLFSPSPNGVHKVFNFIFNP